MVKDHFKTYETMKLYQIFRVRVPRPPSLLGGIPYSPDRPRKSVLPLENDSHTLIFNTLALMDRSALVTFICLRSVRPPEFSIVVYV